MSGGARPGPRRGGILVVERTHEEASVFFFYSSRLGCVTSLLLSAGLTLLVLHLLGWI